MYKKNIIWLASYPKSGNTWFRVFLTNLLNDSDVPANINDLADTSISSSRKIFDEYTGLSSSDLTFNEIDSLRPEVYRMQSAESNELLFKKVHDKYYATERGEPLFPSEITRGVVYIIRNPLDVLVSFAYHSAKPVEKMVKTLNDSNFAFCNQNDKLQNQLRQILGSWSDHVKSWTEQKNIPVHFIRYEDMISNTFDSFKDAVKFIGIEKPDSEIHEAIKKSDFSVLANQEKEGGFKEKMIKSKSFFRKGKTGDWKNCLNQKTTEEVISKHKSVMMKYEYIDTNNKPIY
ncbi:MAG: sulfotransferase domain-containing protein [Bacteroidales bacterium]|nr:sulfotransferase domain-containing protein [Bacteroidales bacterium]